MYSCELEKGQNGKETLKWHKIEKNDDEKDGNNDEEIFENSKRNLNNSGAFNFNSSNFGCNSNCNCNNSWQSTLFFWAVFP